METRASYVVIGAFVMIGLIGLIVVMLWLTGAQYRQDFIYFRTFFTGPVTGVGRGTVVRYDGIEVGNVTVIAFDPDDPKRLIVTLRTTPALKLHVDSVASVEQQGLTGGDYVEITGGTADFALLAAQPGQDFPLIPSKPSALQQLTQTASELVSRFNTAGERMEDALNDDNRKAISEMLVSLRNTTALIDAHGEDLGTTFKNLKPDSAGVNNTLANVDKTLGSADVALNSASKAARSLEDALNSADTTAKKLGQLSDDTDKVLTGQGTAQFTQLMAETNALVSSLTRLSNTLERDPSKLIYGDQRQGYAPR